MGSVFVTEPIIIIVFVAEFIQLSSW